MIYCSVVLQLLTLPRHSYANQDGKQ